MSNNTNNVTVTINTHPFCNLTTNTPLELHMDGQYTFYYYLRTPWLVCQIFLLTIFVYVHIFDYICKPQAYEKRRREKEST